MNGSSYLLDTNIVVALFAGEAAVTSRLAAVGSIFVPAIVAGELYFGAAMSTKVAANTSRVDQFVAAHAILEVNIHTATEFGRVKSLLAKKGRPIPENDIWIAAIAFQHNLVLATRDAHFAYVDGLRTEKW